MNESDKRILDLTKFSLQISSDAYDDYLSALIDLAKDSIKTEGIVLLESNEDEMLVVMYTDYLYRQKKDSNKEMPRCLRYALNNKLFSQKARDDDGHSDQTD